MLIITMTCFLSLGNSVLAANIEFLTADKSQALVIKMTGSRHQLITKKSELSYSFKTGNRLYYKSDEITYRTSVNKDKITLYDYKTGKSLCRIGIKKTHLNLVVNTSGTAYRIGLNSGKLEDSQQKLIAKASFTPGSNNLKINTPDGVLALIYKVPKENSAGLIWLISELNEELRAILIAELISRNL
ncbi:MAG: hypothetical protein NE330_13390 [Lentisphaeraceae bacterium]|nr:hypothetical protein [Lentisphaeraceae bacterium]